MTARRQTFFFTHAYIMSVLDWTRGRRQVPRVSQTNRHKHSLSLLVPGVFPLNEHLLCIIHLFLLLSENSRGDTLSWMFLCLLAPSGRPQYCSDSAFIRELVCASSPGEGHRSPPALCISSTQMFPLSLFLSISLLFPPSSSPSSTDVSSVEMSSEAETASNYQECVLVYSHTEGDSSP